MFCIYAFDYHILQCNCLDRFEEFWFYAKNQKPRHNYRNVDYFYIQNDVFYLNLKE